MSSLPQVPLDAQPARRRGRAFLVGWVLLALLVAGFGGWRLLAADDSDGASPTVPGASASPRATPSALPRTDPELAAYYGQELDWKECGRHACADLRVPLDYAKPDGAVVEVAVLRVSAREPDQRIGSLVVNPGGPGGSGVQLARGGASQFGDALADSFDIVGFDPRGVGESQPLTCLSTEGLDELVAADPDPETPAEVARLDTLFAAFGRGCEARSGPIVRHMSTEEVARDMDILRAALGEAKLDYLGYSYGTFLGATYADLFPRNVGRFVLDGAIDPSLSTVELSLQQAQGFETALRAYVADCVAGGDCFLGSTVDAGIARIQGLLEQLDARPLPGDGDRVLTEGLGLVGVYMPLYVKEYWRFLSDALESAFAGDGSGLLRLADFQFSREDDGYDGNLLEALNAVNCLDHNDFILSRDVPKYLARFERAAPTFGRPFAYSASACAVWPVKSGKRTVALDAKGAPPIVVIGTTRDPATPLVWARAMAAQLDSGRLITRDGDGHTGFGKGNDCVDDAVVGFLTQGKVPPENLRC